MRWITSVCLPLTERDGDCRTAVSCWDKFGCWTREDEGSVDALGGDTPGLDCTMRMDAQQRVMPLAHVCSMTRLNGGWWRSEG